MLRVWLLCAVIVLGPALRVDIDADNDLLTDEEEAELGTDPNNPDTDGDGYSDGMEVQYWSDPLDPESIPGTADGDDEAAFVEFIGDTWAYALGCSP